MFNRREYLPPVNNILPYCRGYLSVNQLIPTGVQTTIIFDTIVHQDDIYSLNTVTGVITVSEDGIYLATLVTICAAGAVGERDNIINYNDGVAVVIRNIVSAALGNIGTRIFSTALIPMDVNGTIQFQYFQNQGAALNLNGGANQTFFTLLKMSDL